MYIPTILSVHGGNEVQEWPFGLHGDKLQMYADVKLSQLMVSIFLIFRTEFPTIFRSW